jgi:hypothetical protein
MGCRSREVLSDEAEYRQSDHDQYYINAQQYFQYVRACATVEKPLKCVRTTIAEVVVQAANFRDSNGKQQ